MCDLMDPIEVDFAINMKSKQGSRSARLSPQSMTRDECKVYNMCNRVSEEALECK